MICDRCQSIPLDLFSENAFRHQHQPPSRAALKASARQGCHTCTLLYGTLSQDFSSLDLQADDGQDDDPVVLKKDTQAEPPLSIHCGKSADVISCKAEPVLTTGLRICGHACGGNLAHISPGDPRTLATTADADENITLARTWIDNCLQSHPLCLNCLDLPPQIRLLDVGSRPLRLVSGDECRLAGGGRYVTLSHCWGLASAEAPWTTSKAALRDT